MNIAETDTPMVQRAHEFVEYMKQHGGRSGMGSAKSQSILQLAVPDHRSATPWEQASTILYLLSEDASNLTGAILATDGGWTAY